MRFLLEAIIIGCLDVCLFVLFRLIESVTVYICLAVICLVCIPTGCCVIGVNAHLLRHFRPFTDNILVYL